MYLAQLDPTPSAQFMTLGLNDNLERQDKFTMLHYLQSIIYWIFLVQQLTIATINKKWT